MPPAPRVVSVDLRPSAPGEAAVEVAVQPGRGSSFLAAAYDRPEAWIAASGKGGFWFSQPVLYVRTLDEASVRAAVEAMAADLGGYWLRYYRAKPGEPSRVGLGTASVVAADGDAGVVDAVLKDGREFSILAATPARWRAELERRGLRFYFGPMALFLRSLDDAHARRAAKAVALADEQLFCRYDTPRKTLAEVLDAFRAVHP